MRYPIWMQFDNKSHEVQVHFPDLGRVFVMPRVTMDELLDRAQDVLETYLQNALDQNLPIAPPSLMDSLQKRYQDPNIIWALVSPSNDIYSDQNERINISMNRRVLARLDAKAQRLGKSRSAMISEMALCYETDALRQPELLGVN